MDDLPSLIRLALHRKEVAGLRPGGVFVLEAFSKEQLNYSSGGPYNLDMLLSLDELMGTLAGLDLSTPPEWNAP